MDVLKLKSFCKVFELRSFSKAASILYLSQPTISSHIISLEKEVGVRLFDRIKKFIVPTPAGVRLYPYAKEIITLVEKAEKEMELFQGKVLGRLLIGGSTIPGHYILPYILKVFKQRYPDVDLFLDVDDSYKILEKLSNAEVDIGVVGVKTDVFLDLEYEPVVKDKLILIAKGCKKKKIKIEELKDFRWVIREEGSGTRSFMERCFLDFGIGIKDLKIAAVVNGTEAVIKCVQQGLGVSIISCLAVKDHVKNGIVDIIEVEGLNMERFFYMVKHKHRKLFPAARCFLQVLKEIQDRLP